MFRSVLALSFLCVLLYSLRPSLSLRAEGHDEVEHIDMRARSNDWALHGDAIFSNDFQAVLSIINELVIAIGHIEARQTPQALKSLAEAEEQVRTIQAKGPSFSSRSQSVLGVIGFERDGRDRDGGSFNYYISNMDFLSMPTTERVAVHSAIFKELKSIGTQVTSVQIVSFSPIYEWDKVGQQIREVQRLLVTNASDVATNVLTELVTSSVVKDELSIRQRIFYTLSLVEFLLHVENYKAARYGLVNVLSLVNNRDKTTLFDQVKYFRAKLELWEKKVSLFEMGDGDRNEVVTLIKDIKSVTSDLKQKSK
jgi:hypothetical protein